MQETELNRILFINPKLVNDPLLKNKVDYLLNFYSKEDISKMMLGYPVVFSDIQSSLPALMETLQKYVDYKEADTLDLVKNHPYLLEVSSESFYWTVMFLRKRGFSASELQQMVQYNPDLLTINHKTLQLNLQFFFRLNVRGKTMKNLIKKHPDFLLMPPGEMLHKKVKIFLEFGVNLDQ